MLLHLQGFGESSLEADCLGSKIHLRGDTDTGNPVFSAGIEALEEDKGVLLLDNLLRSETMEI